MAGPLTYREIKLTEGTVSTWSVVVSQTVSDILNESIDHWSTQEVIRLVDHTLLDTGRRGGREGGREEGEKEKGERDTVLLILLPLTRTQG